MDPTDLVHCSFKRNISLFLVGTDPKIEEDLSEEQSPEHDNLDNDEDERLIQEEMEMSDSDDEHKEMNTSSTVRLKGKSKSIYKRNEKGNLIQTSYFKQVLTNQ